MESPHLYIVSLDGKEHRFFALKDAVAYATREIMYNDHIVVSHNGKERLVIQWK